MAPLSLIIWHKSVMTMFIMNVIIVHKLIIAVLVLHHTPTIGHAAKLGRKIIENGFLLHQVIVVGHHVDAYDDFPRA